MRLHPETRRQLKSAAKGWKQSIGCLPCEATVKDWGCPGCSRWVVVVSFAARHGADEFFCGEYDTRREAQHVAKLCEAQLDRAYAAA